MSGAIAVDTDPGIDDAVALAYLVAQAGDRLRGVTTTYGNCSIAWATTNAAAILAMCGAPGIPVVPGASRPLCRSCRYAADTHGEDGLGFARSGHPRLLAEYAAGTSRRCQDKDLWGPDAIIRWAQEEAANGGLALVCLGPLTNLALALARDPESLRQGIRRVVVMGGSARAVGNITPVSEYNFWCDPEAARAVFASGLPISMVGLDVTREMALPAAAVEKLSAAASTAPNVGLVQVLTAAMAYYVDFHLAVEKYHGCILNDPLAALLTLQPSLAQARSLHVHIECGEGMTRGQSICDWYGTMHAEPNAQVYLRVDGRQAMWRIWEQLVPGVLTLADL